MPDYNAWTKQANPKPYADDQNLRSAGGHIHVGCDLAKKKPIDVIRAMDLFLGVPSVALDKGTLRRQLYGAAGCMRKKPYGVEYRTLSNFWIFKDSLIDWAYEGTERALKFVESGSVIHKDDHIRIQRCINNSDMVEYEHLVKAYGL